MRIRHSATRCPGKYRRKGQASWWGAIKSQLERIDQGFLRESTAYGVLITRVSASIYSSMPGLADIAFECPHCKGPLMAEASYEGMLFECPHCYAQLQVPGGEAVNKDRFIEPAGLRRLLEQVRDKEWEALRRKQSAGRAR